MSDAVSLKYHPLFKHYECLIKAYIKLLEKHLDENVVVHISCNKCLEIAKKDDASFRDKEHFAFFKVPLISPTQQYGFNYVLTKWNIYKV